MSTQYKVGDVLPEREYPPMSRTDIVKYQGASGDFNPIHHDDEFAQKGGYPTAFGVGMYQAGITATYAVDQFSPEQIRGFTVRFEEQTWPKDVLTVKGTVAEVGTNAKGEDTVTIALETYRQTGGRALTASATFAV